MARTSSRQRIVDATLGIATRSGPGAVTFEAVSAETGLTKAGVFYHFASRDDLLAAAAQHVLDEWETAARGHLGRPFDEAPLTERLAAFVRSVLDRDAGAGLRVLLGQVWGDDVEARWTALVRSWTRAPGERPSLGQRVVLLAAQGLWMDDLTEELEQGPADRDEVVAWLLHALDTGTIPATPTVSASTDPAPPR
ncbi:TetR/AcrR family transcriptional regulator [Kineococcus sp. SYSU DK001]|uniref:TetR/AcrR family transcriptional regulator n=1 Tax=Kineococcus sp. SYSU DK001 TaxID=3383122 RepID=UPI003D7DEE27